MLKKSASPSCSCGLFGLSVWFVWLQEANQTDQTGLVPHVRTIEVPACQTSFPAAASGTQCTTRASRPPPLAGSDGFRNWANLLEISSERAGLGNGTHQGLMRIATDVTPLLSQIATEANQPGDRTAERVGERARRTKVRGSRFEVSGTSNLELPTFHVSHFTLAA
jgi:hypothetical protein